MQFIHTHFGDIRRNQQSAVIGHLQALQLQGAGGVGQAHQGVGFDADHLGTGERADKCGEQTEFTHGKP
ncbi:hypothetical protein D3C73_1323850 [compost metagenome]